jgi:hypothetical protein
MFIIHIRASTTKMITNQRCTLILLCASILLLKPAVAWSPFKRRTAIDSTAEPLARNSPMTLSSFDSRLFFRNGQENDSDSLLPSLLIFPHVSASSNLPSPTTDVASSVTSKMEPRAMYLPRHSPPKDTVYWQQIVLDIEIIIGRLSLVAALVLLANEVMTGSGLFDQVTVLFD